jgi:hypothetical protein
MLDNQCNLSPSLVPRRSDLLRRQSRPLLASEPARLSWSLGTRLSIAREWRLNLSFSCVSMLFLNSWRVSVVPYYVTTHPPAIQKHH